MADYTHTIADLQSGDKFELANGEHFHTVKNQGITRRVRYANDNENGTHEVCVTYCGETYTFPSDTAVVKL